MSKQLKGGYLLRYKKRLFGKDWREEWVVLYDHSALVWFKDRGRPEPEGCLFLKESPELMAVGQYALRVPGRPELPSGCDIRQIMAFGTRRNRDKLQVNWFLCKSEEEVNDWMTAISNTLPPPPQPPLKALSEQKLATTHSSRSANGDARPAATTAEYYSHAIPGQVPVTPNRTTSNGYLMNGVGTNGYSSSHYHQHHQPVSGSVAVVPSSSSNNTIIVQHERETTRDSSGLGDLAAGVMMGAHLSNWGRGWGFGTGWGWGSSGHCYNSVQVHNHYDVNNTMDMMSSSHGGTGMNFGGLSDFGGDGVDIMSGYEVTCDSGFDMDFGGDFGF